MRAATTGRWSSVGRAHAARAGIGPRRRAGITLTEILIAIMILGVGLVSLATLFPIGLLRLRDASRWTRSAILLQTAASDAISRGLFSSQSFALADYLNQTQTYTLPYWYVDSNGLRYNPLTQDTQFYGGPYTTVNGKGQPVLPFLGANSNPFADYVNNPAIHASFPGLPFAYDPLWRFQTVDPNTGLSGYYLDPVNQSTFEARFGYGLQNIRPDPTGGGLPSAHGLQRITNFNGQLVTVNNVTFPVMPSSAFVPSIFVSQEDLVWQDPNVKTYTVNGIAAANKGLPIDSPSPVVPDLSPSVLAGRNANGGSPSLDWRYSWLFTGRLASAGNAATFDGSIVILENRPFAISSPATIPYPQGGILDYQVDGEIVVEGVFGYSGNVIDMNGNPNSGPGYGTSADRSVLLRWPSSLPDPVVRPGDWIADVTYERQQPVMQQRFLNFTKNPPSGLPNWANKGEWDNLPAQRCFWYQAQKVTSPVNDQAVANHRSMVVTVNQNLQAKTILHANGTPVHLNAALIAPNVVNVIPQTIFVR